MKSGSHASCVVRRARPAAVSLSAQTRARTRARRRLASRAAFTSAPRVAEVTTKAQ